MIDAGVPSLLESSICVPGEREQCSGPCEGSQLWHHFPGLRQDVEYYVQGFPLLSVPQS